MLAMDHLLCLWANGPIEFDGTNILWQKPGLFGTRQVAIPPARARIGHHPNGSYTLFLDLGKGDVRQLVRLREISGPRPPMEFIEALQRTGVTIADEGAPAQGPLAPPGVGAGVDPGLVGPRQIVKAGSERQALRCSHCGAPVDTLARVCSYCHVPLT